MQPDEKNNRLNGVINGKHLNGMQANGIGLKPNAPFLTTSAQPASALPEEPLETKPRMEWVESLGLFVLFDHRVLQRQNKDFCMRMVDCLARTRKARLTHVDLDRHELVVQFTDPNTSRATAAAILGEAIRLASMPVKRNPTLGENAKWSGFTAFAAESGPITHWFSSEVSKTKMRLYGSLLKDSETSAAELKNLIPSLKRARRRWFGKGVTISYNASTTRPLDLVASIDTICRLEATHILPENDENPLASISVPRRIWHIGMAGFSIAGAVVGLILPGIPTVPFVLLASYHLAKGSARMNRLFLAMPLFGSLARDWSDGRYIRTRNKILLIVITLGILGITFIFVQLTAWLVFIMGVIFAITSISILATPGYPQTGTVPKVGMSRGLKALPGMV
jgi:hypothetical protein